MEVGGESGSLLVVGTRMGKSRTLYRVQSPWPNDHVFENEHGPHDLAFIAGHSKSQGGRVAAMTRKTDR